MDIGKTLYITERRRWRKWLSKNHSKEKEIWLIFYNNIQENPALQGGDELNADMSSSFGGKPHSLERGGRHKKASGKPRISYDDAVLEALAYGWIDSIVKKIDEESFSQRFSPRKPKSVLSQMNKERIRELIKNKKMTEAGLAAIAHVFDPKKDMKDKFTIPPGILKALKKDKDAWKNFQKLPESYKRIRVAYIETRRRHGSGMYQKALANFVKKTAQGKRIGYVKERR